MYRQVSLCEPFCSSLATKEVLRQMIEIYEPQFVSCGVGGVGAGNVPRRVATCLIALLK